MSNLATIVVESRRYSGWVDPRYPIGYWQASLDALGDATGGLLAVSLIFQDGTAPELNSQMYSVERFSIQTSDAVNRDIRLKAVNMGGPANKGFEHEYSVFVESNAGVNTAALLAQSMVLVPWFLGSQHFKGITASLSAVMDNADGVLLGFEAEGYRWGARSVLVDGGPQRPPTGPYRT